MSIRTDLCGFQGVSGGIGFSGAQYTLKYLVVCTDNATDLSAVIAYARATWSVYPGKVGWGYSVCTNVTADQKELLWDVAATFSINKAATPLAEPWKVSFGNAPVVKVFDRCFNSVAFRKTTTPTPGQVADATFPVQNSATDPFDPPLERTQYNVTITLTKNVSVTDWDAILAAEVNNSVNNADITVAGKVIPKWCGHVVHEGAVGFYLATPEDPSSKKTFYVALTATITYAWDTHVTYILDQGYNGNVIGSGSSASAWKRRRAVEPDMEDQKTDKPKMLNGSGGFLADGATPVFLGFHQIRERAWAALKLPTALTEAQLG